MFWSSWFGLNVELSWFDFGKQFLFMVNFKDATSEHDKTEKSTSKIFRFNISSNLDNDWSVDRWMELIFLSNYLCLWWTIKDTIFDHDRAKNISCLSFTSNICYLRKMQKVGGANKMKMIGIYSIASSFLPNYVKDMCLCANNWDECQFTPEITQI